MPQKRNCSEAALELGPLWESNRLILKCTIHRRRKKKEQSHRGCRKVVKWNHERTEKKDRKGRKRSLWYYREIHLFIRGNWVGFAQLKSYNQLFNDWKESWNWERWEVLRKKKKKKVVLHMQFSSTFYQSNISGLPGINPENPEAFTSSLMSLV